MARAETNLHHDTLAGAIHGGLPELFNGIPAFFALYALHVIEPCRVPLLWRGRGEPCSKQGPALAERSFKEDLLSPTKPVSAEKIYR